MLSRCITCELGFSLCSPSFPPLSSSPPSFFLSLSSPPPFPPLIPRLPPPPSSLSPLTTPGGGQRGLTEQWQGRPSWWYCKSDVSLLCQPHPHVEHTRWGNIKVATRGAVCGCGCGCGCVWGVVEMLQEVQCGSICWGECHSCCKKWRENVNVKPDSVFKLQLPSLQSSQDTGIQSDLWYV